MPIAIGTERQWPCLVPLASPLPVLGILDRTCCAHPPAHEPSIVCVYVYALHFHVCSSLQATTILLALPGRLFQRHRSSHKCILPLSPWQSTAKVTHFWLASVLPRLREHLLDERVQVIASRTAECHNICLTLSSYLKCRKGYIGL